MRVVNMVQAHIDRWDTTRDWTLTVHVVPSLGRRDRGAGTALHDLAADGFDKYRDLNSTGLAGKDADIEVKEECGAAAAAAAGGAIGTRQS
jgi:hypothetical protein